ncbi:ribonuclease J [Bartonella sp. DGB2]|uniref:ribonuclease J n=1 Tax=Bartonella sp. DGB2 TaxID=3388426 RepID=UPI00398FE93C
MDMADGNELVFLPLGGVGEIGMNLAAYGYGAEGDREWIVVDMGVSFADAHLPGVDLIFPDIRFLEAERHNIRGIVLTHAHEDHYGAVLDLWPALKAPVYCTAFTAGLLATKREAEQSLTDIPLIVFKQGETFQLGPFHIEAIEVTHSICDPVSLAIKTPLGVVIHTGDWKIDLAPSVGGLTDEKRFRALGKKGVLALLCDSTNAMVDGSSPTEEAVGASLADIIAKAEGRVAITTFSSNIGRIKSITRAAHANGRKVLVLGRSLKRCIDVAQELGYMDDIDGFISEEEYSTLPRNKIVIILTGSQGEARAALAKLARDSMREVSLTAGDIVVFSSRSIPGNEKAIIDIQNQLVDRGIKIITNRDGLVHVSGHPQRDDLLAMYEWVKPQILVPVHGEGIHLKAHAALGRAAGIPNIAEIRNGHILRLAPGTPEIIDSAPIGRLYKDGSLIGSEEELGIGERRKLAYAGHVAVSLHMTSAHDLADDPALVAFGLPEKTSQGEWLEDILLDAIEDAIHNIPRSRRKDNEVIREATRRAVRSLANAVWGKKPICTVFLHRGR